MTSRRDRDRQLGRSDVARATSEECGVDLVWSANMQHEMGTPDSAGDRSLLRRLTRLSNDRDPRQDVGTGVSITGVGLTSVNLNSPYPNGTYLRMFCYFTTSSLRAKRGNLVMQ